ncbi:MAG: cytochrome c oxidase assembly protein [Terriglobales bacterium]
MIVLIFNLPAVAVSGETGIDAASWTWPWYIAVPLFGMAALYLIGIARMQHRGVRLRSFSIGCFIAGWVSLLMALDSPMHEISEQLFWVHMTQHEILMLVSAPLLVLSQPLAVFLWAMPPSWRSPVVGVFKWQVSKGVWLAISAPAAAWLIHAIALWSWHAPVLFDAALHSDFVHALQHASFIGSALLFWWALLRNHDGRLGFGGAILYVFTTAVHTSVLGAWLTFSPRIWYLPYLGTTSLWHISALEDQQLGGLIMWIPAGTLLTVVALVLLAKWLRHSEQRWEYTHTAALIRASQGVTK